MANFRKYTLSSLLSLAALFSFANVQQANADAIKQKVERDAMALLEMWQPERVFFGGDNALVVVLPQRRLTQQIYLAAIRNGLCLGVLTGKPLDEVEQILILNQFAAQGFLYEKGLDDCASFNERPVGDNMPDILILGATQAVTDTN